MSRYDQVTGVVAVGRALWRAAYCRELSRHGRGGSHTAAGGDFRCWNVMVDGERQDIEGGNGYGAGWGFERRISRHDVSRRCGAGGVAGEAADRGGAGARYADHRSASSFLGFAATRALSAA